MNDDTRLLTAPALCVTTARLLRACAGTLAPLGLALAVVATAAMWWRAGLAVPACGPASDVVNALATLAWCAVLSLAPLERLWAWRIHFDAGLFTDLARAAPPMAARLETLDHALHALGLRGLPTHPRPLADRVQGARRLAVQHAALVAVQALATTAALAVGAC